MFVFVWGHRFTNLPCLQIPKTRPSAPPPLPRDLPSIGNSTVYLGYMKTQCQRIVKNPEGMTVKEAEASLKSRFAAREIIEQVGCLSCMLPNQSQTPALHMIHPSTARSDP